MNLCWTARCVGVSRHVEEVSGNVAQTARYSASAARPITSGYAATRPTASTGCVTGRNGREPAHMPHGRR